MTMLDRPFLWIRSCAFCYRFAILVRILLAAAFLPTGMVKLLGEHFTLIGPEHPVGAFFEAMYQTGLFWRFIGLSQVLAAILLLIPGLAHLGAAIFLPIVLNIFVVTISLHFGATAYITGAMVLAVTYLCIWDYDRFRPALTTAPFTAALPRQELDRWETIGFAVFASSLLSFFGITRGLMGPQVALLCVVTGTAAGFLTLARFLWLWWHRRLDPLPA